MDVAQDLGVHHQKSLMTFIVKHMYDLFIERDVEVMEINPITLTSNNELFVNHAKIKIDRDSLYRQQELVMRKDLSQMNYIERISELAQLSLIKFEQGNIGIISNSAGYCMATCDVIASMGGRPANFLDLQGSAYHEKISASLILMDSDKTVDSIFINMYCGQLPADKMAVVVKEAYAKSYCTKPITVRLKGTNSEEALSIIQSIPTNKIVCIEDFNDASQMAIQMAENERQLKLAAFSEGF
uniref:ATP-citrate synthase/succinyl-CoA ligase C-terminal domain-containing protein n=1 Tax=Strombidium rassoulzadegani TaxID=1082188 RepID=A0A7S3CMP5_9SPIT|mmetsp:Transcript_17719/g.29978  ORF Transcript_17719/g.29978 Transcript_17719/m.29978 type:complete len:242 (+) Transcript_17719:622-1347(+)